MTLKTVNPNCPCTYNCPRHGNCTACRENHRKMGGPTYCMTHKK